MTRVGPTPITAGRSRLSKKARLSGGRIDPRRKNGDSEWPLGCRMLGGRLRHHRPIGRVSEGEEVTPGVAAALVGHRRAAGMIVRRVGGGVRLDRHAVIPGMIDARAIVRMLTLLAGRRMVILRGRAHMARRCAAREGKHNGKCQDHRSAALHGIRP